MYNKGTKIPKGERMKKIILVITLLIPCTAFADIGHTLVSPFYTESAYNWTWYDSIEQGTFYTPMMIDMRQSAYMASDWHRLYKKNNGDLVLLHEQNPLLGRHPSPAIMYTAGCLWMLVETVGAYYLPHPYRNILAGVAICDEIKSITGNNRLGLHYSLTWLAKF